MARGVERSLVGGQPLSRPRRHVEVGAAASRDAGYKVQATLYESASTIVYRALRAGDLRPVVLKVLRRKPPRAQDVERLRREFDLGSIANVRSVVRPLALETFDGKPALVLEDFGGESLDHILAGPMDVALFLRLGVAAAGALADVHRHGIVHRDIKPSNLIARVDSGETKIADLGIASAPGLAPNRDPGAAPPVHAEALIEGSLPYMSPEQTGRMNRTVDERSDLYALGVTFYEMLSGHLPFKAKDPVEWIHCHLAREPAPLFRVAAHVPEALSAMVMKLLAKRPEERYQTAAGLLYDLRACQQQHDRAGVIDLFELGSRDAADTFQIPRKLYGRAEPAHRLRAALQSVAETGQAGLVLVSGYSGIGKSSLVQELEAPVVAGGGLFLAGKFDQYQRDVPYSTIARAFREHVVTLLGDGDEAVTRLRGRLDATLGPNADLIVRMFPELERVLGPRPTPPGLPRSEEETRFHGAFRGLLSVLTEGGRTLVLFLDDLQWSDSASLRLLTRVLAHPDTPGVLTVGAYRDNEVYASHPLMLALDELRRAGITPTDLVLGPLSPEETTALVADTVHSDLDAARPLAELVHAKTAGNPFFVIQFLTVLHDEGLIRAVPLRGLVWDVATIRELGFTDNVVDLMTRKLERLAPGPLELLKTAACIGNTVDVATLSIVRSTSPAETEAQLESAIDEGMIVLRRGAYRFLHDRVQQAAYSLIPQERRAEVHLSIGRLLLADRAAGAQDQQAQEDQAETEGASLFDVANHLNLGAHLMTDAGERRALAALNLEAGRKAKASTAYASAVRYFEAGLSLQVSWESDYALAYGLHFERAECLYLLGRFDEAEVAFARILARTDVTLDRAAVFQLEVDLFTSQIALDKAVDAAVRGLAELGVPLRAHPTDEELAATADRVWRTLASRTPDELLDLPLMTDPQMRAALGILAVLFGPSHSVHPNLPFVVYANMVEISLRHGNTDASALGYAYFGMALGPKFGRYREGYAFGKLGYDLAEKHGFLAYKSKLNLIFGDCIAPFSKPLQGALDYLDVAFRTAVETGDLTFACYCCNHIVFDRLLLGEPLGDVYRESLRRFEFARKANFDASCRIITDIQLYILAMRGMAPEALREQGDFDVREFDAQMDAYPWPIIRCWHFIMRVCARYMLGDVEGALAAGLKAREQIWTTMAHLQDPEFWFFFGLTLAAAHDGAAPHSDARARHLEMLRAHEAKLAEWSAGCPENFEAKWALVAAELARVEGRAEEAMALYEQAIRAARRSGFVQNEGLGLELAGRFHRARGFELIGDTYLREARAAYVRWGGFGKVAALDKRYGHLAPLPEAPSKQGAQGTLALRAEWLDLSSIVQASQSISSEVSLERLVETLFRIVLEQGGAQRGILVMARGGQPTIEAEAWLEELGVRTRVLPSPPLAGSKRLPVSLVTTVLKTGRRILLDDARLPHPFSQDEYVARAAPRSVLCLPVVRQAQAVGVLYLENNALTGAFTADRLAALELVAAQAAISLEIAKLIEIERTARAEAEAAERRAAFLADATALLVESLDYEAQLARLANLAVQSLADVCLIDLVDGASGQVRRVAAAQKAPADLDAGVRLPLVTGGQTVGFITLAQASGGPYGARDLELARELANRAAIAIFNARLYRSAQDAVQLRDDFLSVASHELRTPLTSLILSLNALERRPWADRPLAPLLDARRLGQAARQAERLDRLVGDLLDVSHLEAGHLNLQRGSVDLGELVREVVARFEEDASRAGCVVTVAAAAGIIGNWDGSRLDQVVTNLFANAVKFGAGKPIAIRVDRRDQTALLIVKDEGIGIDRQQQERIFERFERAVSPRNFGGLGLGLYVCRRFVDAHGGTIRVSSEPGEGSVFSVELPLG
jgi:predicted ATPase/signal transduction histidine kinase